VRAKDAVKLMKKSTWTNIATILEATHTIPIVRNIAKGFKILFMWKYTTEDEKQKEQWYKDNFSQAVKDFATVIARNADSNYLHEFQYHIQPGEFKYCNDVQETINYDIKNIFHNFTQRRGGNDKVKEH
jgi:hypothetical protein